MAKSVKNIIENLVRPVIENLGYDYVETDFSKSGKDYVLTVYIAGEKEINLGDCEKVSRAIDPVIDEADPIEQSYCLCVSSVDLDKPLKTDRDFEKALDCCVDIKLYRKINSTKEISGKLLKYSKDSISLDTDSSIIDIKREDIAKIVKHIDF